MTEYMKMVPLPSWWQKLELKYLSISKLFGELLSWNLESRLITPKYITGTYLSAIVAIFNFHFSVCFLCVMFFLTPERATKNLPLPLVFSTFLFFEKKSKLFYKIIHIFIHFDTKPIDTFLGALYFLSDQIDILVTKKLGTSMEP